MTISTKIPRHILSVARGGDGWIWSPLLYAPVGFWMVGSNSALGHAVTLQDAPTGTAEISESP